MRSGRHLTLIPSGRLVSGVFVCVFGLVSQSCLTLCDPMDCSLPVSIVHGMLQARILALLCPSPGDLPNPRDRTCISQVSCTGRKMLYHCATREACSVANHSQTTTVLCFACECAVGSGLCRDTSPLLHASLTGGSAGPSSRTAYPCGQQSYLGVPLARVSPPRGVGLLSAMVRFEE